MRSALSNESKRDPARAGFCGAEPSVQGRGSAAGAPHGVREVPA